MHNTPEPELPDPVPATPDAVTPDLPPAGPEAPDIRHTEGGRPRSEEADGADAPDEDATAGEPHQDAHTRGETRPPAGPGTPAPQEETD